MSPDVMRLESEEVTGACLEGIAGGLGTLGASWGRAGGLAAVAAEATGTARLAGSTAGLGTSRSRCLSSSESVVLGCAGGRREAGCGAAGVTRVSVATVGVTSVRVATTAGLSAGRAELTTTKGVRGTSRSDGRNGAAGEAGD